MQRYVVAAVARLRTSLVPECQELHVPAVKASRVSSRIQAVLGCSASLGAFYALHKRYRQGVAHSRTLCPPPVDPKAICEAHD